MNINVEKNNNMLVIGLEGRLDTNTAPDLEKVFTTSIEGVEELELDFNKVEYISSAGLRVLLAAQKKMNTQGSMKLKGVNESVMEVFELTGFIDILTIEQ